jgi:hypothetical protein
MPHPSLSFRTWPAARRATRGARCAFAFGLIAAGAFAPTLDAQPAYDAAFVGQTTPAFIQFQTPAAASITMRNSGTTTWYQAEGDVFLATQEPQDNYYWCIQDNRYGSRSGNRVLLPYDVAPNQEVTFNFVVKPLACGFTATPPFRFRMLSQLHGTFGEETPGASVVVSNAAEFVAQQVPSIVPAGATIQVSVTFKNTTIVTWQPSDGYVLGSAAPTGNTTWTTTSVPLPAAVAPNDSVTFEFQVTAPSTPGTYNFQWQMNLPAGTPFGLVSPATSVQVVAAGPPNYQGLWWNAPADSEAGWGLSIAHQGNVIFATWFTYDATGKGWWLSMTAAPPTVTTAPATTFTGTLVQSSGPPFDSIPFNPSLVRSVAVGTGTLTFTDLDNGTFAYTINGATQTKNITRQVFGPLPTCTFGILSDLTQAYNYQDLWWASPAGSESGWGVNLAHEGDTIFLAWFTYGADRAPLWLVATAAKTAPGTYAGTLYQTTGPPFNSVPFDPSRVVATAVGSATLTFTDGNNGTFDYTVNGEEQKKAITRQVFTSPGTVCQ